MRKLLILAIIILFLSIPNSAALTLKDFEGEFICACGCYKTLLNCDCKVAQEMQGQIVEMIDSGMGKEEIISKFQFEYGEEVLANPPKEGFFTSLWIYPLLVLFSGLIILYIVIRRRDTTWYNDPDEVINEGDEVINENIDLDPDLDEIHNQSR